MALSKKRKVDNENRAFNPECTDLYLFVVTAVHSLQRKLEVFKEDLQGDCAHFSVVQEKVQGQSFIVWFISGGKMSRIGTASAVMQTLHGNELPPKGGYPP